MAVAIGHNNLLVVPSPDVTITTLGDITNSAKRMTVTLESDTTIRQHKTCCQKDHANFVLFLADGYSSRLDTRGRYV